MTDETKPIVEGTEEGRWKHPLETLEHPVAGWVLTSLQRMWGVGVPVFWAVTLMHEGTGREVTANNSTIDLALSDACAEASRTNEDAMGDLFDELEKAKGSDDAQQ